MGLHYDELAAQSRLSVLRIVHYLEEIFWENLERLHSRAIRAIFQVKDDVRALFSPSPKSLKAVR